MARLIPPVGASVPANLPRYCRAIDKCLSHLEDRTEAPRQLVRRRYRIAGTVQGVGFRPFLYRLATGLGLTGTAGNDGGGVWCELQGDACSLREFAARLWSEHPPLAVIQAVDEASIAPVDGERDFVIAATDESVVTGPSLIPPDVGTCSDCLREVSDPDNRRYGHAFACCTDCGPRYTVVRRLPYDRENTALAEFALCPACRAEYVEPSDRRFHAQALCCPRCGPSLALDAGDRTFLDPIAATIEELLGGSIVAVKGLGGYQLLCRADDEATVRRLRERKHREEKPFALLVAGVEHAQELVRLGPIEVRALSGPETPIVLAPIRDTGAVAANVAPGSTLLGVMIPATALHALLAEGTGVALVCTSGNRTSAPIVIDDSEASALFADIADAVLTHDRRIERRADDSVGHVVGGAFQLLRRARGFAPRPVALGDDGPVVLGVGAELKNTIALAAGDQAHLSVHLGDLESPTTLAAFEAAMADLLDLTGSTPDLIVHDLHPEYLSTKFAMAQDLAPIAAVQHHHAHLASCLADNRHRGPAIGVTFDGIGWGGDGVAWGGEILVGDASGVERYAHLVPVTLPGGVAAIRQPWKIAVAHLVAAFGADVPALPMLDRNTRWRDVARLCRSGSPVTTTSVGRLFDAVAALCGVADTVTYEGQAAMGLEQLAGSTPDDYDFGLVEDGGIVCIDAAPVIRAIVDDLRREAPMPEIAGKFHNALAAVVLTLCRRVRREHDLDVVALSGGVFQNRRLVELVLPVLEREAFTVLRHRQVPPNDGGISLGQVAIGRARLLA